LSQVFDIFNLFERIKELKELLLAINRNCSALILCNFVDIWRLYAVSGAQIDFPWHI